MRAFILDGPHKGKQIEYMTAPQETLTFSTWICGDYPSAGYKVTYTYKLHCTINLGKEVAFYKIDNENELSKNQLYNLCCNQMLGQQQSLQNSLGNSFVESVRVRFNIF